MAVITEKKNPAIFAINEKGEKIKVGKITDCSIESVNYPDITTSIELKGYTNNLQAFVKSFGIGIDLGKKETIVDMPEKYIINHGATVLIWKDGTKTIIKRCKEDEFNKRLAFLTAFFQHYSGMSKNKANKFLSSLVVEDEEIKDKEMFENKQPKHMKEENNG